MTDVIYFHTIYPNVMRTNILKGITMLVRELEIFSNTRLMIRGTTFIKITFNEIHQLILGTNGCGKSTIVQELSPLPPTGSDYLKDGYKKITIEHENKSYTLTSTYSVKAGKHSFIDNQTEEELNEGGTQSVQKTLIKEIFNYDQSLHDVLTDQIKFTNMSPLQRRDWLTRISGTNLDYAISLFNKLRRAQRDEEAVVKHLTSRLNKESDGLPTAEDLHDIQARFDGLDKLIKEFYAHRVTEQLPTSEQMFSIVENKITEATNLALELLRTDEAITKGNIKSFDELNDVRSRLINQIEVDKSRVKELYAEHNDISGLLTQTQDINNEEQLEAFKKRLDEIYQEIKQLRNHTTLIKECDNAAQTYGRARGISDILYHLSTELVDNTEGYFTKQKRVDTQNRIDALDLSINNKSRELKNIEHNIVHIELTEGVNCPKCSHSFRPGVTEADLPLLKSKQMTVEKEIDELQIQKKVQTDYIDEYVIYRDNYLKYMDVLNSNRDLQFLEQYIRPIDLLNDSPKIISTRLNTCLSDLDTLAKIEAHLPEVYKLEAVIDKVNSVRSNGNYTQDRLNKIDTDIEAIKLRNQDNLINLEKYDKDRLTYLRMNDLYNQLNAKLDDLSKAMEYTYRSNKKEAIENTITKVNTDLAHVNMQLNEARNKQSVIDDITSQRDKTMIRSNGFKALVNEINPATGLIADYFKQFIDQFVEQMNIIINKVWEHNIELLPCDVNSDGITYKFPLRVNDKPYGPPDGSKGSNSQVSMVNFAFKIVVMVYLGLDDYPLYLDELAPDLDEKHRINIISFVRSFVESKRCSQMFMVSHYATGYGAFTNADILVLDDENLLDIPQDYNHHATINKDNSLVEEA